MFREIAFLQRIDRISVTGPFFFEARVSNVLRAFMIQASLSHPCRTPSRRHPADNAGRVLADFCVVGCSVLRSHARPLYVIDDNAPAENNCGYRAFKRSMGRPTTTTT